MAHRCLTPLADPQLLEEHYRESAEQGEALEELLYQEDLTTEDTDAF